MNPVQSAKPIEYDLFISHSSADALVTVHGRHFHLIEHLKEKLEAHTHPSERRNGRPRRFRVCTYEEDFELKGDVSTAIQDRIRASRFMLVICSKASADSQYVHSELDFFTKAREGAPPLAGLWNVPPHEAFPGIFPPDTIAANFAPSVITSFNLETAVGRGVACVIFGVWQGTTTRNSRLLRVVVTPPGAK